jgi:hypothetical protein
LSAGQQVSLIVRRPTWQLRLDVRSNVDGVVQVPIQFAATEAAAQWSPCAATRRATSGRSREQRPESAGGPGDGPPSRCDRRRAIEGDQYVCRGMNRGASAGLCHRNHRPGPPQIDRPGSPSMTCWSSTGRSPGFQSDAVWTTRLRRGQPSGRSLRVIGRGTQTNAVGTAHGADDPCEGCARTPPSPQGWPLRFRRN